MRKTSKENMGDQHGAAIALVVDGVYGALTVVPSKNPQVLAAAILDALEEKAHAPEAWKERKRKCRMRIVENFGIDKMIENYHRVWGGL